MDIRFDVHDKLIEKGKIYKVMDRGTFNTYAKEHQLNAEGLIDEATAKQFGKLIAADAYVTGKVYMFGSVITIRIKVTNTETGEILSLQSAKLPVSYDMAQFLGIKDWEKKREKAEENKSQNPNCEELNVGDYCFNNNTNDIYEIHLKKELGGNFTSTYKTLILSPNMKSCFKNLKSGSYSYEAKRKVGMVGPATKYSTEFKGDFMVKQCEARIQNISSTTSVKPMVVDYQNSNIKQVKISINNSNFYSRKLIFINKNGRQKEVIIGSKSTSDLELEIGYYKFICKTIFSNVIVEQNSFNLQNDKTIVLNVDHKN